MPTIVPQGRINFWIVDQIVNVFVFQVVEKIVDVVKIVPQERVSSRTVEQIVYMPCLRWLSNRGSLEDRPSGASPAEDH